MQEYLPFIIGLGLVMLQFYNNFRKEQEKARNRNPTLPAGGGASGSESVKGKNVAVPPSKPMVLQERGPVAVPAQRNESERALVQEYYDPQRPYEPVYERNYREPLYKSPETKERVVSERKVTPQRVEVTHLEDWSDETLKGRAIHSRHVHGARKQGSEDEGTDADFDMEQAIISQAILNRPEY
ncbi:hypothetical protein [Arcticibacter sp. MXS-1]|uniref:hypothetical protein n=1 Tax=Arcticibacter sp. MXS-1 TaxID=3341726 RepID=UPI0035A8EC38